MPDPPELSAEDAKLVTLARAARPRSRVVTERPEGAAVRDETGRTYQAARVEVAGLDLSALRLAVAMALSSGAASFEAAAVVADGTAGSGADAVLLRSLGVPTLVVADPDGTVRRAGPP